MSHPSAAVARQRACWTARPASAIRWQLGSQAHTKSFLTAPRSSKRGAFQQPASNLVPAISRLARVRDPFSRPHLAT